MAEGASVMALATALGPCVCVRAGNEAQRRPLLLAALAQQSVASPIPVTIALNNTVDDSRAVIAQAPAQYHVTDVTFALELAHAGSARRPAMEAGLAVIGSSATEHLVSTDADTRPLPRWLEAIRQALSRGADLVGGRIKIDPAKPLPKGCCPAALRVGRLLAGRAIEDDLDPMPWTCRRAMVITPGHRSLSAPVCINSAAAYRRWRPERVARVAAVVACGGRLAHPAAVFTFVSLRRDGRAMGGMALAVQELHDLADAGEVSCVPGYRHWRQRAIWRRDLRAQDGPRRAAAATDAARHDAEG